MVVVSCAQCGKAATRVASSSTQPDRYKCSDIGCACTDAALEYRLHLLGSDDTCEAEFTLLGRVAQDIVGVSPQQAILNNCLSDIPVTNLALAATQICHTPHELAAVVSSSLYTSQPTTFVGRGHHSAVEASYPPE